MLDFRDRFIPPYCYVQDLLGCSEKQLRIFFKSNGSALPHGIYREIQYTLNKKFAFFCLLQHGVCTKITVAKWIKKTNDYVLTDYYNSPEAEITCNEIDRKPYSYEILELDNKNKYTLQNENKELHG